MGLIAFLDPPKDSAAEALRLLKEGQVAVKVLTGDNPVIARKTCRDVGLEVEGVLLGNEVEAMEDDALAQQVEAHHDLRQARRPSTKPESSACCGAGAMWWAFLATASTTPLP